MKLSRELWLRVEPMLETALQLEPGARAGWLAGLASSHPELAPIVGRLLGVHERADRNRALETVPRLAGPAQWSSARSPGEHIGPFELLRPIGHGGMGEVWLARQADGRVQREVALKLPALHPLGGTWRERFARERDILARLEHPHIARLYDAGVSEAGQPWLAMEFVAGLSLLDHVAARPHSTAERLALFRQVLSAVAHAHRHLVVHRDLKPANILIDGAGQVKLLDFGIAKLLDAESGTSAAATELTRVGGRVMTLRYAAPEQVAAGEITTATDVYALGVILHELLTGLAPYRAVRENRPFTEVTMLEEQVALPSGLGVARPLARQLAGDLDAIMLKALRRVPAERYASVELFDEDILAHLDRRPVKARAGTWRYLAGRFVARRKLPLAAGTAILVTLVTGLVVAEHERRTAVAEKARAERHFANVRALANSFIFEVHGEIEHLVGSLPARRKLVGTAAEYLDRLAGESRGEPALALEVAGAYRKLAEISGDAKGAHLGDRGAARRYAARASALLAEAGAADPANIEILREHRIVSLLLGRLRLEGGDTAGVEESARGVGFAQAIARHPRATFGDRRDLGATYAEYGGILAVVRDDHAAAAVQLARAVEILEALVAEQPGDIASRVSLSYAYERAATAAEATGEAAQLPRAIAMVERSIATAESVARDAPGRLTHLQTLVKLYNSAARLKVAVGDIEGARRETLRSRAFAERLMAEDPRNVSNHVGLVSVLAMGSDIEQRSGRRDESIRLARAAIAAFGELAPEMRTNLIVRDQVDGAKRAFGASVCPAEGAPPSPRQAALLREARTLLLESRAFKQELVDKGMDARAAAREIGEIDANLGRCDAALDPAGRR